MAKHPNSMSETSPIEAFQLWLTLGHNSPEALSKANNVRVPASLEAMLKEAFLAGVEYQKTKDA